MYMVFCAACSYRPQVMKLPKFVSFNRLGSGLIDVEQKTVGAADVQCLTLQRHMIH